MTFTGFCENERVKKMIRIKSVKLIYGRCKADRKIKVELNTGATITIEALYESWRQYGGTEEELWVTLPTAEKYNGWLHGEDN